MRLTCFLRPPQEAKGWLTLGRLERRSAFTKPLFAGKQSFPHCPRPDLCNPSEGGLTKGIAGQRLCERAAPKQTADPMASVEAPLASLLTCQEVRL